MTGLHAVPPDPSPDDAALERDQLAELLRRSARGDEDAFARLYDATSARVHGLVLRVIRNPSLAEEVTQEVFLEAWRQSGRFDADRGTALSWLLTMGHRRAVDRIRSTESASRNETAYHQHNHQVEHDATAEAVESNLEARRVRGALDSLTEVQREALQLAYFGGYTHSEVARLLDLPLGTTKTRIRDGLIRMRDAIGVGQ
jgi:RNA polymerase sigma-70 factor (ECF subfamily)